ncbi:MAG: hypothetical protein ABSE20_09195 [Acetobacteraceae bacterium]
MVVLVRALMLAAFVFAACAAEPGVSVSQLHFRGFCASRLGDMTVYCLLGTGFLALRSHELDKVIKTWIADHPNAEIVPVDTPMRGGETKWGEVALQYVWIRSGEDFLNVALVRAGVYAGGVMIDPAELLTAYPQYRGVPPVEVPQRLVSDEQYQAFRQRILDAEELAWKEREGIWSDEFKQYRDDEGPQ